MFFLVLCELDDAQASHLDPAEHSLSSGMYGCSPRGHVAMDTT